MLRRARLGDFRGLTAIDPRIRADREHRAWLRQAVRERGVWVLVQDRGICAYGVMRRVFFHRAFIEMLFVAESERRRGYGRQLLAKLENEGHRHGEVWTSTNRSNRAMQRLLKQRGYRRSGQVVGLDAGDPELFYVKRAS